jgi:hypothetical protein
MSSAAAKILKEALELSTDERRKVAERLLETLPHESAEELEQLWNTEALRRAGVERAGLSGHPARR